MFEYTRLEVNQLADSLDYNRNITEKVLRLYSILQYFDESEFKDWLVLKGGTAINLFLLDLPRLSVDIDLDFNLPLDREHMLEKRRKLNQMIKSYMMEEGYRLNEKSKSVHSLDSYVYSYTTLSGAKDILKIEINYSDRVHVLKPKRSQSTGKLGKIIFVNRLSDEELIASKMNALLVRTTPRDVYDVYNIFKSGYIKNEVLIRKIAVFYVCLGSEIPINFDTILGKAVHLIKELTFYKIKGSLIPVLHKRNSIDVNEMRDYVAKCLLSFFQLDESDLSFIREFNDKRFLPQILFDGLETEDVNNHPIGIWKTLKKQEKESN